MAIIKACSTNSSVGNTGKECNTAMGATAMLIAIDPSTTFTDTDLLDPSTWLLSVIHQRKAFPIFGLKAPINMISNNNAGNDIIVTLDDGTDVFLRYAIYNRMFETTAGGLCYAKSLQTFNHKGYYIIEIDQEGKLLFSKNADGTNRGLITTFMYSPSPILADFKSTPYKNRFQISYSPVEMVNNGTIYEGGSALLSIMGLIDTKLSSGGTQSVTDLLISIKTDCAGTDLIALFGTKFAAVNNFIITDKVTGAVVTSSGVTIVSGKIQLAGTFVSARTYHVVGASPAIWQSALIEGYDGSSLGVDLLIP